MSVSATTTMHRIGRTLSRVIDLLTVVAGLAIATMMLHITADVIARAVFNSPLPGTTTAVSNYYMVIAAFIPLAFVEQKSAHISVELLTDRLPKFVQKHLAGLMLVVSAVIFAMLAMRTWQEAMTQYRIGTTVVQGESTIQIWQSYFFLPIGCGLMFLTVVYKIAIYLSDRQSGLNTERAQADSDGIG